MADENDVVELETSADIAAARHEFLSNPPGIVEDAPVVDEAAVRADEAAVALDELTPPVTGTPAPDETGTTPAVPAPGTTAPVVDPYAAYGGEEAVRLAAQVQEALRTEPGIRALVANGLTALGYSVDQVRTALDSTQATVETPAPTSVLDNLADDDIVTVGSIKTLLAEVAQQAAAAATAATTAPLAGVQEAIQQQQAQQLEQRQQVVRGYTDQAVIETLGAVPTNPAELATYQAQVNDLLAVGQKYYDPAQSSDPAHLHTVIQRAHADIEAQAEARFQAYLATKRQARDNQPVNTGGGAGVESPLPEPKNMKEAREQAKAAGFFS